MKYPNITRATIEGANASEIQEFLDNGSEIDERDDKGRTPLMQAIAMKRNPEIVKLLIDQGADVDAVDDNGETPLHYATLYTDNLEVVKLLAERGADMEVVNHWNLDPTDYISQNSKINEHDFYDAMGLGIEDDPR